MEKASKVVRILEQADYRALASLVKKGAGIQFLPYIYDLTKIHFIKFDKSDVTLLMEQNAIYTWGKYDGSGDPIKLTPEDYHNSFIYDFPYVKDAVVQVIEPEVELLSGGLRAVVRHFDGSTFVLYRYEGSTSAAYNDWRALLMVFRQFDGEWFLIGIGHGEKTL